MFPGKGFCNFKNAFIYMKYLVIRGDIIPESKKFVWEGDVFLFIVFFVFSKIDF